MTAQAKKFVTEEECRILGAAMQEKYAFQLEGRTFEVSAKQDGDIVYAKVILRNADDSFHYPVEGRLNLNKEEMESYESALFLIDYIDAYFEEYLQEGGDLFLPIDWTDYEYLATNFQIKGQIFNLKVEKMADQLLERGERYEGPQIII